MALLDRSAKVSGCSPAKQMISATSVDDVFAWPAARSTSRASRGKQFLHAQVIDRAIKQCALNLFALNHWNCIVSCLFIFRQY